MWQYSRCNMLVLVLALCQYSGTKSQVLPDIGTCQSEYLEQPPDLLTCNPYINTELKLDCIVRVPTTGPLSGRLSVDWFHNSMLLGTPELTAENQLAINRLDGAQENITIREQTMLSVNSLSKRIRSRLEVRRLDKHDVGQYWCGIRIDSSEWMLLSDPLQLEQPSQYAGLEPCSTTVAQSKRERKCAMWSFKAKQPTPPPMDTTSLFETLTTTQEDKYQLPETTSASMAPSLPPEPTTNAQDAEDTVDPPQETIDNEKITTSELPEGDNEGLRPLMVAAIGVLVTFGVVIMGLATLVVCMCIKYRKIVRGKRKLNVAEEKGPRVVVQSPSTIATDYLVPISMTEQRQRQVLQIQPRAGENPVYMSELRQEFTSFWLEEQQEQQQEQQRLDLLEHSYESMAHDYEDIFLESLNSISGGSRHPVLMKTNEAYTIPRSLNFSIDPSMLPLY